MVVCRHCDSFPRTGTHVQIQEKAARARARARAAHPLAPFCAVADAGQRASRWGAPWSWRHSRAWPGPLLDAHVYGAGSAAAPRPLPCPPTAAGLHSVSRLVHTQPVHKMRRGAGEPPPLAGLVAGCPRVRQTDAGSQPLSKCARASQCQISKCTEIGGAGLTHRPSPAAPATRLPRLYAYAPPRLWRAENKLGV